jgi:hypothetical protein
MAVSASPSLPRCVKPRRAPPAATRQPAYVLSTPAMWVEKTRTLRSHEPVTTKALLGDHATERTVDLCFLITLETHQSFFCSK